MHYQVYFIVIDVCILRWLHKDFQITKILIITVHMIYWNDDVLSSYPNMYMRNFCTSLHHYCTLLYFIISDMNSVAHKPTMVSCPIGVWYVRLYYPCDLCNNRNTLYVYMVYLSSFVFDNVYMPIKKLNLKYHWFCHLSWENAHF